MNKKFLMSALLGASFALYSCGGSGSDTTTSTTLPTTSTISYATVSGSVATNSTTTQSVSSQAVQVNIGGQTINISYVSAVTMDNGKLVTVSSPVDNNGNFQLTLIAGKEYVFTLFDDQGSPITATIGKGLQIDGDGKVQLDVNDSDGDGKIDTVNVNIETGNISVKVDSKFDDQDGDNIPDVIDIDEDNDGKPDFLKDKDGNGKPDIVDDQNGDGEIDTAEDEDMNGIPDHLEDYDKDGKINAIDDDDDNDGIKDEEDHDDDNDGMPDSPNDLIDQILSMNKEDISTAEQEGLVDVYNYEDIALKLYAEFDKKFTIENNENVESDNNESSPTDVNQQSMDTNEYTEKFKNMEMEKEEIFEKLSNYSEKKHVDIVKALLDKYEINPSEISTGTDYSTIYDTLLTEGSTSITDAYKVGCKIEVNNVNSINAALNNVDNADIKLALEYIRAESYKHYWMMDALLKSENVTDGCCSLGNEYCKTMNDYPITRNEDMDSSEHQEQGNMEETNQEMNQENTENQEQQNMEETYQNTNQNSETQNTQNQENTNS